MIKLIHGNGLEEIGKYSPEIIIADIPWGWDSYEELFDRVRFNSYLIILVDNVLKAFSEYLKQADRRFKWTHHGLWLHDDTFTHILVFTDKHSMREETASIHEYYLVRVTNHPEERPVELMEYIIDKFSSGKLVLDPFMGSGASGVAAKRLGNDYVGVEINKEYHATAKDRINGVR